MKKIASIILTFSLIFTACNKIDTTKEIFEIIGPVEISAWDSNYAQTVIRKIYVEEFTGHRCIFCPDGARILKTIMENDPTIITTAIHCSNLADPISNPPFDKNFKTPMGDLLCEDFNIKGLPKAMMNRKEVQPNDWGIDRSKWISTVNEVDRANIRAGIQLHGTVDETKQEIEVKAAVTIIKEVSNPVQLCLVLQQDSIISGQTDGSTTILDYVHNHVLRAGFNGNYGTKLTPDGKVKEHLKYTTTFKLFFGSPFPYLNIPVNIRHCSVVAYLIDLKTKEVIQVESTSLN